MVWIQIMAGAPTRDVDLPNEVVHRSGGSALLLIPDGTQEITEDEWQHLQGAEPEYIERWIRRLA